MSKFWTAKVRQQAISVAKSQGITDEDLAFMLNEFFRLAEIERVEADESVDFIAQTDNQWLRQKPLKEGKTLEYRNIIDIDRTNRVLDLLLILKKNSNTYNIVEQLWRKLTNG